MPHQHLTFSFHPAFHTLAAHKSNVPAVVAKPTPNKAAVYPPRPPPLVVRIAPPIGGPVRPAKLKILNAIPSRTPFFERSVPRDAIVVGKRH